MTTYTSREAYEFISKETNDPIVEWKTCKVSGQPFPITQWDIDFYNKISPTFDGKRYQIPTPSICPEERQKRRMSFRNERKLYKGVSASSGKSLVSLYSPDKPFKVYAQDERWSDKRDAMEYAREYDFNQPFTENFKQLVLEVPRISLHNQYRTLENAEYNNVGEALKDCYYTFGCNEGERNLYLSISRENKDTVDGFTLWRTENCYEGIELISCYECLYCLSCIQSHHLYSCTDLQGCSFCINCHNLRNQSYCIDNKKVTPEEFQTYLKEHFHKHLHYNLSGYRMHMFLNQCEDSFWNALHNSHHALFSYDSMTNDSKWTTSVGASSCCVDTDHCSTGSELIYEDLTCVGHQVVFCSNCFHCSNVRYSDNCHNSQNCFACVGLRDKKYCILNKQYEKAEYERLVAQIIEQMIRTGEWGAFFHPSLSPFGYNETVASTYYPTEKSDFFSGGTPLSEQGYHWSDFSSDPAIPENARLLRPAEYSDDEWLALNGDDEVLKAIVICAETHRPFTIQKLELQFYRKHGLPLPKFHPDVRSQKRMQIRAGRTLYFAHCDRCQKEMISVYCIEQWLPFEVYCEECYRQEAYR